MSYFSSYDPNDAASRPPELDEVTSNALGITVHTAAHQDSQDKAAADDGLVHSDDEEYAAAVASAEGRDVHAAVEEARSRRQKRVEGPSFAEALEIARRRAETAGVQPAEGAAAEGGDEGEAVQPSGGKAEATAPGSSNEDSFLAEMSISDKERLLQKLLREETSHRSRRRRDYSRERSPTTSHQHRHHTRDSSRGHSSHHRRRSGRASRSRSHSRRGDRHRSSRKRSRDDEDRSHRRRHR